MSGNPTGKPKPKPEEPDGLDDAARMRRVLEQPAESDCNSAQRVLRGWLEKNPASYVKVMTDLEERSGGGGRTSPDAPPADVDEGEERTLALIAELLDAADRRPV